MHVSRPLTRPGRGVRETSNGLELGRRVRHGKFGEGVVLDIEGSGAHARVHVNFEGAGTKCLVMAYAKLELM
jgi:DNA helicase-2/ATP-dependent DNA helicase PcrA